MLILQINEKKNINSSSIKLINEPKFDLKFIEKRNTSIEDSKFQQFEKNFKIINEFESFSDKF